MFLAGGYKQLWEAGKTTTHSVCLGATKDLRQGRATKAAESCRCAEGPGSRESVVVEEEASSGGAGRVQTTDRKHPLKIPEPRQGNFEQLLDNAANKSLWANCGM